MMSLTDLDESTAFERFALESTASLLGTDRRLKGRYDTRTDSGATYAYSRGALFGGAEKLRRDLRPLMFGAAWKIIDQIIEYVIGAPPGKHTPVDEKVKAARAMPAPIPIDAFPKLWDDVLNTYAATLELRNGLVHRKAEVAPDRTLRVLNKHTQQFDVLDPDQQLALCRLSQRLITAILDGSLNDREVFDLSAQLLALRHYSGAQSTIGRNHSEICELIDRVEVKEGEVALDVLALIRIAQAKIAGATYIDYVGILSTDETTALCGALDMADPREYRFKLDNLPAWLHAEGRLTE